MNIKEILRPGDIINVKGMNYEGMGFLKKIVFKIVIAIILWDQKRIFGPLSNYYDHHTMVYFDDDHVFSVEPPKPLFRTLASCLNKYETLTVYRYNRREINSWDHKEMMDAARTIVGWNKSYDYGQLMDDLVSMIAGYPAGKFSLFDFGRKNYVCSAGAAAVMNKWRHRLRDVQHVEIPRIFSKLNFPRWTSAFLKTWKGHWPIERTTPANFANTDMFDREFSSMGMFLNGESV